VPREILEAALYYLREWGVNVVFWLGKERPLHRWQQYFTAPQTPEEVEELYASASASGREPTAVAAVVDPGYRRGRPYTVVVDIDRPSAPRAEALEALSEVASRAPVVLTRRGYHIWLEYQEPFELYVESPEAPGSPAVEAFYRRHLAHLPPSQAASGGSVHRYSFHPASCGGLDPCLDPGDLAVRPSPVPLQELSQAVERVAGVRVSASPGVSRQRRPQASRRAPAGGGVHLGYMESVGEVLSTLEAMASAGALPRCLDWAFNSPRHPKGTRWVAGQVIVLAAASLLRDPASRWGEIRGLLASKLEGFPEDDHGSLEDRLRYLVGERGPRYWGLVSVPEHLCRGCPYAGACLAGGGARIVSMLPGLAARFYRPSEDP